MVYAVPLNTYLYTVRTEFQLNNYVPFELLNLLNCRIIPMIFIICLGASWLPNNNILELTK